MVIALSLLVFCLVLVRSIVTWRRRGSAPLIAWGWQDRRGFHYGRQAPRRRR